MNIESMKLQMAAVDAARAGKFEAAAMLTEQASLLHEGKSRQDLQERAARYRSMKGGSK